MSTKHSGGTYKRISYNAARRYATPTAEQQTRVITVRRCPVCGQERETQHGKLKTHQTSRDERGGAIWPPVVCAGSGQRAATRNGGGAVGMQRAEEL